MKNNKLLYIVLISILSINTYSQASRKLALAEKKYNNYAYIDAIKIYEKVAAKGYSSPDMFKKIGNAYYFNSQLESAKIWYEKLFATAENSTIEPEYYYRYAQSLRASNENNKANEILELFNQKLIGDNRGRMFKQNTNYLDAIKANSGRYTMENASVNSQYSDYGTTKYLDQIVFTTARDTGNFIKRKHSWTNNYFTNLYKASVSPEMKLGVPEKFNRKINTKFNESTASFTKDGNTMYFTRNNYIDGKKGKNDSKTNLVKIYRARLVNNQWQDLTELPFDSDQYNTAHPCLSPDEKTLYFASDMPGTLGQSDIYKVTINEDGTFDKPQNLGDPINTEGRESFPFINEEGELYFASDGHPGLGGFDVFAAKKNSAGSYKKILNLGSDINSPKDDFAYSIDIASRTGFFTSNRDGGKGSDDIYSFLETKKLTFPCDQILFGKITDIKNNAILPNAKITLLNDNLDVIASVQADEEGKYEMPVDCDERYSVRASLEDYTTQEKIITTKKDDGKTELNFALEEDKCTVTVGDDLGKCFGIKMIYFDYNKYDIKTEAAIDLEKILDAMQQYPLMKLEIRSHTDSRGSSKYNQILSQKRANSTVDWLIKNGISADRLTGKGFGESQLINKCSDGVSCTEAEHQENRRSEFMITEL